MAKYQAGSAPVESVSTARRRYRVELQCPTPLGENPMTVEAGSADEAKAVFMRKNNILASDHPFCVAEA